MNAKQLIAAVAMIAASGATFAADNGEYVDFSNVKTAMTRAEVRAELDKAYVEGKLGGTEYVEFTRVASTRSRDDVRKEAIQAAKSHTIAADYFGS